MSVIVDAFSLKIVRVETLLEVILSRYGSVRSTDTDFVHRYGVPSLVFHVWSYLKCDSFPQQQKMDSFTQNCKIGFESEHNFCEQTKQNLKQTKPIELYDLDVSWA